MVTIQPHYRDYVGCPNMEYCIDNGDLLSFLREVLFEYFASLNDTHSTFTSLWLMNVFPGMMNILKIRVTKGFRPGVFMLILFYYFVTLLYYFCTILYSFCTIV